jgi:hypothetical protein
VKQVESKRSKCEESSMQAKTRSSSPPKGGYSGRLHPNLRIRKVGKDYTE